MKVIVETSGNFGLLNTDRGHINSRRPSVALYTQFVEAEIGTGRLRLFAKGLPDSAKDSDFAQVLKDSKDVKVAVTAFCALFGLDVAGDKLPQTEGNIIPQVSTTKTNAPMSDADNSKTGNQDLGEQDTSEDDEDDEVQDEDSEGDNQQ